MGRTEIRSGRGQDNGNSGPPRAPTTDPVQLGWVLFVYDDNGQLIGEYDERGNPLRLYVWLENMPLAMLDSSGIHYLHTDHLHTPRVATDQTGRVSWQADYTPFGEVTETVSQIEMNLRFPGQYHDRETGLHQNWHREYAPHLGRYTQSDPIGLRGGLNVYAYALLNPLVMFDRDGLEAQPGGRPRAPGVPFPEHVPTPYNPESWEHSVFPPTRNCQCVLDCASEAELTCNIIAPHIGATVGGIIAAKATAGLGSYYGAGVGAVGSFSVCWLTAYSICEYKCRGRCNMECAP